MNQLHHTGHGQSGFRPSTWLRGHIAAHLVNAELGIRQSYIKTAVRLTPRASASAWPERNSPLASSGRRVVFGMPGGAPG